MTPSSTGSAPASWARARWNSFLLRERERIATACAPGARDAVVALALAGAERAAVAEHLLEGHVASALALYREATVFHLAAYLAARTGDATLRGLRADDVLTRFRALDPPAPLAGGAASHDAFFEAVRGRDALAVDGPDAAETRDAAEAAPDSRA